METETRSNQEQETQPTTWSMLREIVKFTIIVGVIIVPIRMYIAQPFIVSGRSMDPTFKTGQYLIVDEISYRFSKPERGDVVVIRYPRNPSTFFIKRIIGLPNETIEIKNGVVTIKTPTNPVGFVLDEPYVKFKKSENMVKTLGDNEYFVMGDNRAESFDSRAWGSVPRELVVGKAFLRLLPVASAEVLPGEFKHI